jgi:hypothetical protein
MLRPRCRTLRALSCSDPKLTNPGFLADMRPLLAAAEAARLTEDAIKAVFAKVFTRFVALLPGDPWVHSDEMKERFGITAEESER